MRTATTAAAAAAFSLLSAPALATQNPYNAPDDTWISLSGTAVETGPSSFWLDYGNGTVLVEMDDFGWYEKEGVGLLDGDKVTVYGEVDDDLFETASIEASSVYVQDLGSYFYASAADEENNPFYVITPVEPGYTQVLGTVTSVGDRDFGDGLLISVFISLQSSTIGPGTRPQNN